MSKFGKVITSLVAAGILLVSGCAIPQKQSVDIPDQIVEWAQTNVYNVGVRGGSGTGFFVDYETMLTACHVVVQHAKGGVYAGEHVFAVQQTDTRLLELEVMSCNKDTDMAVLKMVHFAGEDAYRVEPTIVSGVLPEQGKAIWGAGHGLGERMFITFGHMQQEVDHSPGQWLATMNTIMGDSGSPALVMAHGRVMVVGMRLAIRATTIGWGTQAIVTHMTLMGSGANMNKELDKWSQ